MLIVNLIASRLPFSLQTGSRRLAGIAKRRTAKTTARLATVSIWTCAAVVFAAVAISARAGTVSPLYSFTGGTDGADPAGGVISDTAGNLYGETDIGGNATCLSGIPLTLPGCGTVYSLTTAGTLNVLVSFTGSNGANAFYNPAANINFGNNGLTLVGSTLYGSTFAGGASNAGILFSVHTDGSAFTILHQFSGTDGRVPVGNLRQGAGGVLYGITEYGGTGDTGSPPSGNGVLFSITSGGTFAMLHAFSGRSDGANPVSLLISSGTLVGSTLAGGAATSSVCPTGCGTLYTYTPSTAKLSTVQSFNGHNGANAYVGSVGPQQTLYGVAENPFSISKASPFSYIAKFGLYAGGEGVSGPLYTPGGTLYGVNSEGPSAEGAQGTLYSILNGKITILTDFGNGSVGANPEAQPIITPKGAIIGTSTRAGLGCTSCGTIWEYTQ